MITQTYSIDRISIVGRREPVEFLNSSFEASFFPVGLHGAALMITDSKNLRKGILSWKSFTGSAVSIPTRIEYTIIAARTADEELEPVISSQRYGHDFPEREARIIDLYGIPTIKSKDNEPIFTIYQLNELMPAKIFKGAQALQFVDKKKQRK